MRKFTLTVLLNFSLFYAYSQAKWFSPTGERLYFPGLTIVGDIAKSLGPGVKPSFIDKSNGVHICFYVPLTHKLLAVDSKSSMQAKQLATLFSKEKYFGTYLFELDFKSVRNTYSTQKDVISVLGNPASIDTISQTISSFMVNYNYQSKFALQFENGHLIAYKKL